MEARDVKIKLSYERYVATSENDLMRTVYEEIRMRNEGEWARTNQKYKEWH